MDSAHFDSPGEAELRQRIAEGSHSPADHRDLSLVLASKGQYDEAASVLRQALELSLGNVQRVKVSLELGWLLHDVMGQVTPSRALAQDAWSLLAKERDTPEVCFLRGSCQALIAHCMWFTDANAGAEAARLGLEWLQRLIVESPDYEGTAMAYYEGARLYSMLGNAQKAVAFCEECLQHELDEHDRGSCLIVFAEALRCAKQFTRAEQVAKEALRYVGADKGPLPLLYFTLGLIQRDANRPADARNTFQETLRVVEQNPFVRGDPDFLTQVHWNLGELYYESGEYGEAAAAFEQVLHHHQADDSHHRNALLWLGHCFVATRVHAKARDCYEEVLASPRASEIEKRSAQEGLAALPPPRNQRPH